MQYQNKPIGDYLIKERDMRTIEQFTDAEILKVLDNALNPNKRQAKKMEKLNAAMADFFNIGECGFVEL